MDRVAKYCVKLPSARPRTSELSPRRSTRERTGAPARASALGSAPEPSVGPLLELERGVLAYVLGRWLAAGPWRVSAVLPHPAPLSCADLPVRWPLEVRLADRRYAAAAWLPRDAPTVPPRRPDPGWRARVRVAIGAATLRRATARTLAPGDTLIPDRLATDAATLIVGRSRWRARPIERGWQIEHQEPPMSDPDEPLALDAPITLTVELAHMEVSLEAIAGLAPGAVLETGRPIGGPVTLRAGGAVLARGELVDVEGELGVRILETARATDSRATDSRSKGSRSTG